MSDDQARKALIASSVSRTRLGVRRLRNDRGRLQADASAGLLLGVESVPDGLASGLLAGVNPLAGLYGYLYGMVGAACFTSSTFMAVQATGAMSLVVADAGLSSRPDPQRALFTLAMVTGVVMILAGMLRAGRLLRFVPTAVMTGFITAVGVNIVLGQLSNFTGYASGAANRLTRAVDLVLHPWRVDISTLVVGVVTIALIALLTRTRLKSLGMVLAVVAGSALAAVMSALGVTSVMVVGDLADVPRALPTPVAPALGDVVALTVPAFSLALIGLVQGAAVSGGVPNPDGGPANASKDFIGQGAGNIASGLFQGMPVGGSMSASALVVAGGAKSRLALFIAGAVMVLVILLLGGLVGYVAMPSLAGLLIVVGIGTIKPAQIYSVMKTGPVQITVMSVTFILTVVIPLQYAVLTGVALALVLHVVQQSNQLRIRQLEFTTDGRIREIDPPSKLPSRSVVVLQPYGSLFFASAPAFQAQLPLLTATSLRSVVILRLRGFDTLGLSLIGLLRTYAGDLHRADSTLKLVVGHPQVLRQLTDEGIVTLIGSDNVYLGNEWLGATVRRAYDDAKTHINQI